MSDIIYTPPSVASLTGSGSSGQVTFWSASTVLTGSNNLFWNNSNGRLGIGTNSPVANLDVVGTSNLRDTLTVGTTGIAGSINFIRPSGSFIGRVGAYPSGNGGTVNFGSQFLYMDNNYHTTLSIADGTNLNAFYGIKTAGSTSATLSLLILNSSSTKLFQIDDAGTGYILNGFNFNTGNNYITATSTLMTIAAVNSATSDIQIIPFRQVNINNTGTYTAQASTLFQLDSTTKGMLLPRMTDTQITSISTPPNGLMVYSTTQNVIAFYDGTSWHKVTHTNL